MEEAQGLALDKSIIVSRLREGDVHDCINHNDDVVAFARDKKRAAVLVPLIVCENGELQILLTVRAQHLRTDGGDVAFPGGKKDEDDPNDTATALREAWEEVGLYQTDVEVVSQLPPMIARAGHFVVPVVGFIPEHFEPNINPNEVGDIFRVPLIDFLAHDHHTSYQTPHSGRFAFVHFFNHTINGTLYVTYGLTAYICIVVASIVFQRKPDFQMEPDFDYENHMQGFLNYIKSKTKSTALSGKTRLLSDSKI